MSSPPKHRNQPIPYTKPRATTYEQAKENLRKLERKNELEAQREKEKNEYIEIDLSELFKPEKKSKEYYKQKREFKPYTIEERKAYGQKQREYKEKGEKYEAYIAEYYRSLGYEVIEHGKIMGRKDGGIDLIAKKESEIILIQCKNWGSRAIKHSHIKEFLYNAKTFIEENNLNDEIEYLFVASNDTFDKSAKGFIYHTKEKVNFKVIPYLG